MVERLRALVEVETPSLEPQAQLPALEMLRGYLEPLGFEARHIGGRRSGGMLLARPRRRRRGRPVQLLLGHCDTVWPRGTLAERPVELEGSVLRGPGAYDMKGGLVQMVGALELLADLGVSPEDLPLVPVVFVNSDEEIGSPDSAVHIERLARVAQRAYVLEPSLGSKGELKTARKGVSQYTVVAHGRAAHAGLDPEAGASAILAMSATVQQLFALNDPERGVSVNVGELEGGMRANVIAPRCRAVVDVRAPTLDDARRVDAAIRSLESEVPGVRLEVERDDSRPPLERTARNRRLWKAAVRAAAALGLPLQEGLAGGGSDGSLTSRYTATLDGLGAVGGGAHAENEFVDLDRMVERTALLTLLLAEAPPDEG